MNRFLQLISGLLVCALILFSCKKDNDSNVLTIAATPEPHAALLHIAEAELAKQNITLKITEFTDYVTPNEAVESGEQLANFFQHIPYMESFNKEHGCHLVSAGAVHVEPLALYSKKHTKLSQLKQGAAIAIPNDPTNEARALLLLQTGKLITLTENSGLSATPLDIVDNPLNLSFVEIEAASLPRVLEDVDAAVINGNYAIPAGLSASKHGLLVEGKESPYANVIAVKAGNEQDFRIRALMHVLQSDIIRTYLSTRYPNGEVLPAF